MIIKTKRRRPRSEMSKTMEGFGLRFIDFDYRPRAERRQQARGKAQPGIVRTGHIGPSKYMPHIGKKEIGRYA